MTAELTVYRKLDLATFTGDAWAEDATLATPPADIERLAVTGDVRWAVLPMSDGSDLATQVSDVVTEITSRSMTVFRGANQHAFTASAPDTGGVPATLREPMLVDGDVVVLAIPSVTTGGGSAPWLWIVTMAGLERINGLTG